MKNFNSPLIAMVATTGNPSRNEISTILDFYKTNGFNQVLIYCRDGCEVDYLSEGWFRICGDYIELAAEKNMYIWLYDEFNWPSGHVDGKIAQLYSNLRAKHIKVSKGENGINIEYTESKRYASSISFEAVQKFIELTHEEYAKRFSEYFGNTIRGIFTDEPTFTAEHIFPKNELYLPYYDGVERDIEIKTGKKLIDYIKEQYLNKKNHNTWTEYYKLISDRFCYAYFRQLRTWCDNHNLLLTGHLLLEHNCFYSNYVSGDALRMIRELSFPGIDEIYSSTEDMQNGTTDMCYEYLTYATIEYAAKRNNSGAIAELFSCGPCDMPFSKMRQIIYFCAMHGVTDYLMAIAPHDARGCIKKNYFLNLHNYMQPWHSAYRLLADDAKKAASLASKSPVIDIAVRHPVTLTYNNLADFENQPKLDKRFTQFLASMIYHQNQWGIIHENDISSAKLVFSMTEDGFIEENSGILFKTSSEAQEYINKKIKNRVIITENGELPKNILLKVYSDNTFAIVERTQINTEFKDRNLTIKSESGEKNILLPTQGIFISTDEIPNYNSVKIKKINEFNIVPSEKSFLRCLFKDNTFSFETTFDSDVYIILRKYENNGKLILDGNELKIQNACVSLPHGYRNLYNASDKIHLKSGKHEIIYIGNSPEVPYLPLAFISGDFAFSKDALIPVPKKANDESLKEIFKGFSGTMNFSFRTEIPDVKKTCISFNPYGLYAKIYINGELIGEKAWAPYVWQIPKHFIQKNVEIKISLTTSIAPLFGTYDVLKSVSDNISSGKHHQIGLSDVYILSSD